MREKVALRQSLLQKQKQTRVSCSVLCVTHDLPLQKGNAAHEWQVAEDREREWENPKTQKKKKKVKRAFVCVVR